MHTLAFRSPTGNIRCAIDSKDPTQLLCKTLNNGKSVDLGNLTDMETYWTVTIPGEIPTLAYRHGWDSADFYCWSEINGTYCRSLYSRYGFLINRDGIQDRVWPKAILHYNFSGGSGGTPCADGWVSPSSGSGTCSWHGGEAN